MTVLDRDQVDGIREALARGMTRQEVVDAFAVSMTTVRGIERGRVTGKALAPADVAERWRAACMTADEWTAWQDTNRRINQGSQAPRPCSDCTLGFAAEMRAEGRCNGSPAGAEHDEEENDMDPVVTPEPKAPTRQVRIAVTAPCGGCSHVQVCRIADEVRAIADTTVAVPKVGPSLALELSASISCEFYTPIRKAGRPPMTPEQRAAAGERLNAGRAAKKAAASQS